MKKSSKGFRLKELEKSVLDQVPASIFSVDRDFKIVFMNAAGCSFFGMKWKDIKGKKCRELFNAPICNTPACPIHHAMEKQEVRRGQTEMTREGRILFIEFAASPLMDEQGNIIGGVEVVQDITQRVEAEKKAFQLQQDIMELSTPVLSLWKDVLAIPLIGTVDSKRAQDVMETGLNLMQKEGARVLIIDITGVPLVDTQVANNLIRMATAVRLMGSESILTGISSATAKTIVQLGIDLSMLNTRSTLAQGLKLAMEITGKGGK